MTDFNEILINSATERQLENFIKQPAHGLLLTGMDGAGKRFIAELLAAKLLGAEKEKLENHPYFFKIMKEEDNSEISIDAARQLIKKLSLKVASGDRGQAINRVAVIEDAGSMSTEAQNATLKLLEEPPEGSLIILTADSEAMLLPTVASRVQKIAVRPVSLEAGLEFFRDPYKTAEIETAWRLSQGSAGLMHALLDLSAGHPLKLAVDQAKEMLRLKPYERAIYLQNLAKDKAAFLLFLEGLSKVLAALNEAGIRSGRNSSAERLLKARQLVNRTLESAEANTNIRLLALSLALNTPI